MQDGTVYGLSHSHDRGAEMMLPLPPPPPRRSSSSDEQNSRIHVEVGEYLRNRENDGENNDDDDDEENEEQQQQQESEEQYKLKQRTIPRSIFSFSNTTTNTTTHASTSTTSTNNTHQQSHLVKYVVKIVQVIAGAYHSVFLDDEGCVYTAGETLNGACGFSFNSSNFSNFSTAAPTTTSLPYFTLANFGAQVPQQRPVRQRLNQAQPTTQAPTLAQAMVQAQALASAQAQAQTQALLVPTTTTTTTTTTTQANQTSTPFVITAQQQLQNQIPQAPFMRAQFAPIVQAQAQSSLPSFSSFQPMNSSSGIPRTIEPTRWDREEHKALFGRVVKIQAGGHQTVVLTNDGAVWTCGKNDYGQCGRSFDQKVLAVPGKVSFAHLRPQERSGGSGRSGNDYGGDIWIDDIESGYYHTVCLVKHNRRTRQRLFAFGELVRNAGRDQARKGMPIEVKLPFSEPMFQMSAGVYHTLLLLNNGQAYTILQKSKNQYSTSILAGVTTTATTTAKQKHHSMQEEEQVDASEKSVSHVVLPSFTDEKQIVQVSCGFYHSVVRTVDGRLTVYNHKGKFNVEYDDRPVLLSSGHVSSLVVTSDMCGAVDNDPYRSAVQERMLPLVNSERFSDLIIVTQE